MKRILIGIVGIGLLLVSAVAFGGEVKVENLIPGRYALLVFMGADPNTPLNKQKILAVVKEELAKAKVKQIQYVIYDEGKKPSDTMRAYGYMGKEGEGKRDFGPNEIPKSTAEQEELTKKIVDSMIGYQTTPKELYDAYSDNEVVADDDFKGKPITLNITVEKVANDFREQPYIEVPAGNDGFSKLRILVKNDDPLLRKIGKGTKISIKGYPQGLVMGDIIIEAEITISEKNGELEFGSLAKYIKDKQVISTDEQSPPEHFTSQPIQGWL